MVVQVVFEDDEILVVNKPPFMVVNRAESVREATLQDWIEKRRFWTEVVKQRTGDEDTDFYSRSGVVHRLDKETSGVLVVAKNPDAFLNLSLQFAQRKVEKTYLTIVHGRLVPKRGSLSLPLSRNRRDRQRFGVSIDGKKAQTSWRVVEEYSSVVKEGVNNSLYQGFSYVEVKPRTGRTHQIRVHMAHLKHPVVGDSKYVGKRRGKEDRKWCPRQFLHAYRLGLKHPKTMKGVSFQADLPEDLSVVKSFLK